MFVVGMEHVDTGDRLAQAYLDLQRRYRNLVTRGVAGMYRTTLDGRILECNDAMAHMLGYADALDLMRQKALRLYVSAEERERFLRDLEREGKLVNYEIRLQHRNGRTLDALENVYLEQDPGAEPTIQGRPSWSSAP
jgi:PAS domain S-box-containing protein